MAGAAFAQLPTPAISSVSPAQRTAGSAGFTLTVNGSGFAAGMTVDWNGSPRQTTFVGAGQLTALISSSDVAQVANISITVATAAGAFSNAVQFPVVAPSTISTLNPTAHTAGFSDFTLTVTGTNFTANTVVTWNGSARPTVAGTGNTVIASISASDLTNAGTANVAAVNDGVPSNTLPFTINPAPSISSLSPATRPAGSAGFTMTVNGANFLPGATASFNGLLRNVNINPGGTSLTFAVTSADLANPNPALSVTVVSIDGVPSNAASFTVSSQTITSLSPGSRTAGSPGFTLTVTGTGFTAGMSVDWNGSPRPTTFVSATQLTAAIATADLATPNPAVPITVVAGQVVSNAVNFTVAGAPSITALTTPQGTSFRTAGSAAFTLTVTGTNFVTGMTASFNGSPRQATTQSATQLTFPVSPSDVAQPNSAIPVLVTTSDGASSNTVNFTVNPAPTITNLNPAARTATSSGFTLTVTGANFLQGSTVTVNGASRPTSLVSSTQATVSIGAADLAAAGTVPISVVSFDSVASNAVNLIVNPVPAVTAISPSAGSVGSPGFTMTVTGTGFTNSTTVTLGNGALPTTFVSTTQLNASVPAAALTAAGTASVTVTTTDGVTASPGQIFTVVQGPAITALNPTAVTAGAAGFTLTITGTSFVSGSSQAVFGGNPVTSVVNSATTLLASIPASAVTTARNVPVQVSGPGGVVSNTLNFTVNPPITITSGPASLTFTSGTPYVGHNTATGGTLPYSWSAVGLPGGLGINPATGDITGTPNSSGTLSITVTVTDVGGGSASARYNTSPPGGGGGTPPPLVFAPGSLPNGTVGVGYLGNIATSGGTGNVTLALNSGSLPDGLIFTNGLISGTPTTPGNFSFTVTATDSTGVSAGAGFSILINPAQLLVTGVNPSDSQVGASFSFSFGATGGVKPYSFSVNGTIPNGTTVSGQTISGTLTTAGSFSWTIVVTDKTGTVASKGFSVSVAAPGLTVIGGTLPDGQVGVSYNAIVGAANGVKPYTFSGSAPAGLTVNADGSVTGTPTQDGQFTVNVTVTDKTGAKAAGGYSITIQPPPLTLNTTGVLNGQVGVSYASSVLASGGVKPYTFTFSNTPDGISGNPDGSLTGTPTTSGSFTVSVSVKDAASHTASTGFGISIAPAPLAASLSAGNGTVGVSYSGGASASGGVKPYTFSATGLPSGLSINATTGAITGTPSAAGTTGVTVTVTDSNNKTATASAQVTISLPSTPPVTFSGVSPTGTPGGQQTVGIQIANPYPVDMSVTLTLTFAPDNGPDDPTVVFVGGGRTAHLTIPAGATASLTTVGVQVGTVAGLITITAQLTVTGSDVTPAPPPTTTIRINSAPPTISSATATRNSTGFTVVITGFVPDREITSVTFTFNPTPGSTLQTTTLTIPVDQVFSQYFSGPGAAFGSQFTFTQPFTVQGSSQSVASVTITMVNKLGSSSSVTVNLVG